MRQQVIHQHPIIALGSEKASCKLIKYSSGQQLGLASCKLIKCSSELTLGSEIASCKFIK